MAEYIEREAAYKFMFDIPNPNGAGEIEVVSVDDLDAIPAADVVPVVRCGECKHWFDNGTDLCSCDRDALLRRRDFFCADGARMDGDGE